MCIKKLIVEKMPKISLIVPFYSVEPWIGVCLDSMVHQTLDDIEIICVDDCSPDGSRAIVQQYMDKDPRIKLITHTENKGLGGARNTGVQHATGEYIWFIDSDDIIALDACEVLFSMAKKEESNAIYFDYKNFQDGHQINWSKESYTYSLTSGSRQCRDLALNFKNGLEQRCAVWIVFLKKSFYLNSGFSFCENTVYEDQYFQVLLFKNNSLARTNYVGYYYRQRLNSITQTDNLSIINNQYKSVVDYFLTDFMNNLLLKMNLINDTEAVDFTKMLAIGNLTYLHAHTIKILPSLNNQDLKKVSKQINHIIREIHVTDIIWNRLRENLKERILSQPNYASYSSDQYNQNVWFVFFKRKFPSLYHTLKKESNYSFYLKNTG